MLAAGSFSTSLSSCAPAHIPYFFVFICFFSLLPIALFPSFFKGKTNDALTKLPAFRNVPNGNTTVAMGITDYLLYCPILFHRPVIPMNRANFIQICEIPPLAFPK